MLRNKVVCALVALLVFASLTSAAHAEKLLRWKFTAGQKMHAQLVQRIETETAFSNKPVKLVVEVTMGMTWTVESAQDDEARVAQSIDQVVLRMTVPPGGTVEYDSANAKKPTGDAKELAGLVAPLLNAKFVTRFKTNGEIVDVSLPDETSAALASTSTGGQSPFTKERISQLLRQSAAVLPEKAIDVGAKWEDSAIIDSPLGKLKQTVTYTYEGEEDRDGTTLDKIRIFSELEVPPAAGNAGPVLKEQTLTGALYFNNSLGRVSESSITQKMKTETKVRENVVSATAVSTLKTAIQSAKQ